MGSNHFHSVKKLKVTKTVRFVFCWSAVTRPLANNRRTQHEFSECPQRKTNIGRQDEWMDIRKKKKKTYFTPCGWMVGQSVWTPGVKTVWYIPGVKTAWCMHACFICFRFHSPLLTSERSKLVQQLKAKNLPLSSWWLWQQQLNIYCSKNNLSVDMRGGPVAGSRCDLSFILPHLA